MFLEFDLLFIEIVFDFIVYFGDLFILFQFVDNVCFWGGWYIFCCGDSYVCSKFGNFEVFMMSIVYCCDNVLQFIDLFFLNFDDFGYFLFFMDRLSFIYIGQFYVWFFVCNCSRDGYVL